MILTGLELENFRNYTHEKFVGFSPGVNLIYADNAQGKTNMIEAVFLTACGKSFKNVRECKLIKQGEKVARVRAEFKNRNVSSELEMRIYDDRRKSISIGGVPITKISQMLGVINAVVFAPEDMRTVKESPSLRRRFLDMEISKLSPAYYTALQEYSQALKNKNVLLKNPKSKDDVISAFNETMALTAVKIIHNRVRYVDKLQPRACEFHGIISMGKENFDARYKMSVTADDLFAKLERNLKKERDAGASLIGPHRDDLLISIDGFDTREYCSQGQQRTAMLALKLGAGTVAREYTSEHPILLLDDVFSELDAVRRNAVLTCSRGMQIFITTTHKYDVDGNIFRIENGKIVN